MSMTQKEVDKIVNSFTETLQKHEWIDSGCPGGSCWCKHCDVDFHKRKSEFCEISVDDFLDFDDFEEEII